MEPVFPLPPSASPPPSILLSLSCQGTTAVGHSELESEWLPGHLSLLVTSGFGANWFCSWLPWLIFKTSPGKVFSRVSELGERMWNLKGLETWGL